MSISINMKHLLYSQSWRYHLYCHNTDFFWFNRKLDTDSLKHTSISELRRSSRYPNPRHHLHQSKILHHWTPGLPSNSFLFANMHSLQLHLPRVFRGPDAQENEAHKPGRQKICRNSVIHFPVAQSNPLVMLLDNKRVRIRHSRHAPLPVQVPNAQKCQIFHAVSDGRSSP